MEKSRDTDEYNSKRTVRVRILWSMPPTMPRRYKHAFVHLDDNLYRLLYDTRSGRIGIHRLRCQRPSKPTDKVSRYMKIIDPSCESVRDFIRWFLVNRRKAREVAA